MKRNTLIEKDPTYIDAFKNYSNNSAILNSNSERPNMSTIFWSKQEVLSQINRLQGNSDGIYRDGSEKKIAEIPYIQKWLKEIEEHYSDYCENMKKRGLKVDGYPSDLGSQKLNLEGRLDVCQLELKELNRRLAEYTEKEKAVEDEKILLYGLEGCATIRNGICTHIDSAKVVTRVIDGEEMLIVGAGKYAGMSLPDYRELCLQWREYLRQDDEIKLLEIKEQAKLRGLPIPSNGPIRCGHIDKSTLLEFPAHFKRYSIEDENS